MKVVVKSIHHLILFSLLLFFFLKIVIVLLSKCLSLISSLQGGCNNETQFTLYNSVLLTARNNRRRYYYARMNVDSFDVLVFRWFLDREISVLRLHPSCKPFSSRFDIWVFVLHVVDDTLSTSQNSTHNNYKKTTYLTELRIRGRLWNSLNTIHFYIKQANNIIKI